MVRISEVFKSPFYWGEISMQETIDILNKAPKGSYLFRKIKNGSVTIACLYTPKILRDIEIRDCECNVSLYSLKKFVSLEHYVQHINSCLYFSSFLFNYPIKRGKILSLKEISLLNLSFLNSKEIKDMIIPETLKLEYFDYFRVNHDHFLILLNEKKCWFNWSERHYEHLVFKITREDGKLVDCHLSFNCDLTIYPFNPQMRFASNT